MSSPLRTAACKALGLSATATNEAICRAVIRGRVAAMGVKAHELSRGDRVLVKGKPHIVTGTSTIMRGVEVAADNGPGKATGEPTWIDESEIDRKL